MLDFTNSRLETRKGGEDSMEHLQEAILLGTIIQWAQKKV